MNRYYRARYLGPAAAICVVFALSCASVLTMKSAQSFAQIAPPQSSPLPSPTAIGQPSPSTYSLQNQAQVYGNYVTVAPPSIAPMFGSIDQITHASTLIIAGTALRNQCSLSADGTFITTDYQFSVQMIYKGHLPPSTSIITVSLPGGRVAFNNPAPSGAPTPSVGGTTVTTTYAEIRAPWFKKMQQGKTYILFLVGFGGSGGQSSLPPTVISGDNLPSTPALTFQPVGGPQGVYEVTDDGIIKSNSGRAKDPAWQYHNMGAKPFLDAVRLAIKQEPISSPPRPM